MKRILLLLLCTLYIFCSCNRSNENDSYFKLSIIQDNIRLPLDSTMGFLSFSLQYYKDFDSNLEYICIGNHLTNTISLYNLQEPYDGKNIIKLETEGANSVGITPWAFYINNLDSIFILSHWEGLLSIVNKDGEVIYKSNLAKNTFEGDPHPWASTDQPIIFNNLNKNVYVNGIIRMPLKDLMTSASTICHKLNSDSIEYLHPFPQIYSNGFWGSNNLMKVFTCQSNTSNELIYGYAIDDSIKIGAKNILAKSKWLNAPKPYAKEFSQESDQEKLQYYEAGSGCYSALIADPYRGLYYRLVQHEISREEFNQGKIRADFSIIVLDDQFKNLGEFKLPAELSSLMYVLTPTGLHFANEKSYKSNENYLSFDQIEFIQK